MISREKWSGNDPWRPVLHPHRKTPVSERLFVGPHRFLSRKFLSVPSQPQSRESKGSIFQNLLTNWTNSHLFRQWCLYGFRFSVSLSSLHQIEEGRWTTVQRTGPDSYRCKSTFRRLVTFWTSSWSFSVGRVSLSSYSGFAPDPDLCFTRILVTVVGCCPYTRAKC